MDTLTIRNLAVDLPDLHDDELTPVQFLDTDEDRLSLFTYAEASLRTLALSRTQIFDARLRGVTAQRADLDNLRMSSVELTRCDLASLTLTSSRLSRVRFTDCRLLGARLNDLTFEHVVFERCRFDYATFTDITAKGPVAFLGCSLVESEFAGCDLSGAAFDDCALRATSFQPGTYNGTDLRDNDLSTITGAINLKRIVIDHHQLTDLATVLADELEITFADDR
ncbi:pentapeptide repeat-containing protein [Antribacter sp. KLBMP9083]|uniref:Pentapeptide repeat-containing protein n=1 Tax=Antribacter soli TaxID=2910976 RepID=A0AA41QB89_9MICO|nr:pentapeptide repeat-containing protein [Antribacter soli]MCF4119962.1 pentapeptide repeat-containing protein [Antribacter soli]